MLVQRAEGTRWPSCSSTGATAPRPWSGSAGARRARGRGRQHEPAGGNSRCHDQARLAASRLRRPLPGARRLARPGERTARHEQRRLRLNIDAWALLLGAAGAVMLRTGRRRPYGYFAIATAGRSSRASRASPPPTRPRSCSRLSGSSPSACRYSAVASTPRPSPIAPSRPPPNPACSLRFRPNSDALGLRCVEGALPRVLPSLDAVVSPADPHTLAQDDEQERGSRPLLLDETSGLAQSSPPHLPLRWMTVIDRTRLAAVADGRTCDRPARNRVVAGSDRPPRAKPHDPGVQTGCKLCTPRCTPFITPVRRLSLLAGAS
jgi:hypothetical protein